MWRDGASAGKDGRRGSLDSFYWIPLYTGRTAVYRLNGSILMNELYSASNHLNSERPRWRSRLKHCACRTCSRAHSVQQNRAHLCCASWQSHLFCFNPSSQCKRTARELEETYVISVHFHCSFFATTKASGVTRLHNAMRLRIDCSS